MYCAAEHQHFLLLPGKLPLQLVRAAPSATTASAASFVSGITSTLLRVHCSSTAGSLSVVEGHYSRNASIASLLLCVSPCYSIAHCFPSQQLSSRHLLSFQHRAFYHLVPLEHFSVIELVPTFRHCAVPRPPGSNIPHLFRYYLVHGCPRNGFSEPTLTHPFASLPSLFRCTAAHSGNPFLTYSFPRTVKFSCRVASLRTSTIAAEMSSLLRVS